MPKGIQEYTELSHLLFRLFLILVLQEGVELMIWCNITLIQALHLGLAIAVRLERLQILDSLELLVLVASLAIPL